MNTVFTHSLPYAHSLSGYQTSELSQTTIQQTEKMSDSPIPVKLEVEQEQQKKSEAVKYSNIKQYLDLKKFTIEANGSLSVNGKSIALTITQFSNIMGIVSEELAKIDGYLSTKGVVILEKKTFAKFQDGRLGVFYVLNQIGKGLNGVVYRVVNLCNGIFSALKIARTNKVSNVLNEIRMLKFIHAQGVKCGIQSSSEFEFNISGEGIIGFTGPLYISSLKSYIEKHQDLSFIKKINFINQLLQAIKELRSLKVWHGDIHSDNVWLADEDNVIIGDFDGTVTFEVVESAFNAAKDAATAVQAAVAKVNAAAATIATGNHLQIAAAISLATEAGKKAEDIQKAAKAIKCNRGPMSLTVFNSQADMAASIGATSERDYKQLFEVAQEMDLYGISISIFLILTGAAPYTTEDSIKFWNYKCISYIAKMRSNPGLSQYSSSVQNFLKRMLDHDRTKRPSLEESIKFWSELTESAAIHHEWHS